MNTHFPGESSEYRAARDRLLQQEIELRRLTEAAETCQRTTCSRGWVPPAIRCRC